MSVFEFVPSLVVTAAWRVYSPPHKETFQILRDCRLNAQSHDHTPHHALLEGFGGFRCMCLRTLLQSSM